MRFDAIFDLVALRIMVALRLRTVRVKGYCQVTGRSEGSVVTTTGYWT